MTAALASTRPGARRDYDWALALLSLAGALCCTWLLVSDRSGASPASELPPIATLSLSKAEVRRRPLGTLAWNELDVGAPVFDLDSIFVPPGSGASLTFEDGSQLDVEENSLVVIQRPVSSEGARTQVQLVRGSASGVSGAGGMELRGLDFVTGLPANAGAKVNVQPGKQAHVEVFAGTAVLKTSSGTHPLEENHAADIGADGALRAAQFAVALTSPPRGARYYFQHAPDAVDLRWKQGDEKALSLEIATDRLFSEVLAAAPAIGGTHRFQPPRAGAFWWRLLGSDGVPRSEIRRLEVFQDLAPIPSSPGIDEQIDTFDKAIAFAWSAVQNAPAYRVELSRLEDFSTLVFSGQTASSHLTVRDALPEGPYFWRVRTVDPQRGVSPYSEPRSFILIDRPLPDVPELIDSALEVTGGKKQR